MGVGSSTPTLFTEQMGARCGDGKLGGMVPGARVAATCGVPPCLDSSSLRIWKAAGAEACQLRGTGRFMQANARQTGSMSVWQAVVWVGGNKPRVSLCGWADGGLSH